MFTIRPRFDTPASIVAIANALAAALPAAIEGDVETATLREKLGDALAQAGSLDCGDVARLFQSNDARAQLQMLDRKASTPEDIAASAASPEAKTAFAESALGFCVAVAAGSLARATGSLSAMLASLQVDVAIGAQP